MTIEHDKVGTLRAQTHGHEPLVLDPYNFKEESKCFTLRAGISQPTNTPMTVQEAYRISSDASNVMRSKNPNTGFKKADISPTIDTIDPSPSKAQGGLAIVSQPPHCFKIRSGCEGGGKGYLGQDDKSFTLATGNDQYMMNQARVRKLTPRECERLQGFPDDYTKIPYRNKSAEDCPDSPRYKAIGNSWAVPCVRWIGERIQKQIDKHNIL